MLKIKRDKMVSFLEKIKLNNSIVELLFNFTDSGLEINTTDLTKTSMVTATLNKNAFTEYEQLGEVGVQNLQELITILKTFDDDITITKSGNLLTISENKYKLETELVDSEYLEKAPDAPQLEYNEKAEILGNEINKFISNININKTYTLNIQTEDKKLVFNNTGKYKFTKEFDSDVLIGGFKGSYSTPFIDAITAFSGKIVLNMNKDKPDGYPINIYEKTDDSIISIIVAPIMSNK
jgi:hypothetical protein